MKILAIHYGFNASIAYVEDGKLLYLLHEEKFDNIKNSICFPIEAVNYLKTKVDITTVDRITIGPKAISKDSWKRYLNKEKYTKAQASTIKISFQDKVLYKLYQYFPKIFDMYNDYLLENPGRYKKYFAWLSAELTDHLGFPVQEDMIDLVDHHVSHALSTVYFY